MRISTVALLVVHALVLSKLVSGASIDKHESEKPPQTAVFNLLEPVSEKRVAEENLQHEVDYDEDEDEDEEYYYDDEDDYEVSGDYMPRVALSSKPKDPSKVLTEEKAAGKRRRGKGRKKGKGKKRNPCLKKYKDFCIHGTCQYLSNIRKPSCICHDGYSGERCHDVIWILPSSGTDKGYNRTTALAVVAVVLSSLCLIIIGLLLALRFHKRGAYDVENEEKVKLGAAPHH
ncbi:heparin-binding EGF-like growth factor a [Alosa sapidissima]|uniref:heparin-binding EGF-like growth factor a n=1 Tax=Alosa sapidissima TaxID=34773 RepID=UPI001C092C08|nr:heparin-binding EGF-like growth factor a [Alosa sapidissima]